MYTAKENWGEKKEKKEDVNPSEARQIDGGAKKKKERRNPFL